MWLINTTTLKLKFFDNAQRTKYAILSHRWEEDEVTFDEFQAPTSETTAKQGYLKISTCCIEARRRGLEWAWVDTCCIDKRSSAELQEAINTMFEWYRSAVVCFVFLSDIQHQSPAPIQLDCLRSTVWFTRAWTLQELLAPTELCFYDAQWRFLGSRVDLEHDLSRITNVPRDVLKSSFNRHAGICVAEIMSWAAGRKATRTEDIAYSLLGLFDVSIPMLYGEGHKAFIRLQEEILRRDNDQSIFAYYIDDVNPGLLASSPDAFKLPSSFTGAKGEEIQLESSLVWMKRTDFAVRKPTKLTNDGISLEVALCGIRPMIYVAALNAKIQALNTTETPPESRVWIWLQRLDSSDRYCRIPGPDFGITGSGTCLFAFPIWFTDTIVSLRKIRLVRASQSSLLPPLLPRSGAQQEKEVPYQQPNFLTHKPFEFSIVTSAKMRPLPGGTAPFFEIVGSDHLELRPKLDNYTSIFGTKCDARQIRVSTFNFHVNHRFNHFHVTGVEVGLTTDFQPFFRLTETPCLESEANCAFVYDHVTDSNFLGRVSLEEGQRETNKAYFLDLVVPVEHVDNIPKLGMSRRFQWSFSKRVNHIKRLEQLLTNPMIQPEEEHTVLFRFEQDSIQPCSWTWDIVSYNLW